ncbi:hypothetical protein A0H81_03702 [Grifola frondosa]|uniref:BTB domain-containing protein n=1 Tax=Grifola frondosa TaxID=5627 RepID=A0A1C7MIV7_GRIFR|nr:hypothetical protein A0H81_03702 [Grifola frondosa]
MESAEWESVLQYVSEPLEFSSPLPVAETTVLSLLDSQIPTPPASFRVSSRLDGSPGEERDGNTVVSVSTTFFPGASLSHLPPDLIFLSSDAVFFYVHSNRLLSVSDNSFSSLLPPNPLKGKPSPVQDMPPIISLSDSAQILNIVLHTAYDISWPTTLPPSTP